MSHRVVWYKFTEVSEVLAASIIIALMMEAVSASETSVNFYETTRRNLPEDSHLHSFIYLTSNSFTWLNNKIGHLRATCFGPRAIIKLICDTLVFFKYVTVANALKNVLLFQVIDKG
jgi:hypothetical protein